MWNHRAWLSAVLVVAGLLATGPAEAREPTKWALLIGVDDYAEVNDLRFAGNDQRALADQLKLVGFPADQVFLMHDRAEDTKYLPNRNNIQAQLDLVLALPEPGDTVVVAFSGHGVHLDGTSYLLPTDARLAAPAETMVEMARVYERLEACPADIKLLLVDACRNDPRPGGERGLTPTRGTDDFAKSLDEPPKGILQFTSCKEGQVSIEEPGFRHGVFMHFMLEGLQGKAADDEGIIRLARLVDYVQVETKKHVVRKHNVFQSPAIKGEIDGPIELFRLELPEEDLTNSLGMQLRLIPAGEFLMGSDETKEQHEKDFGVGYPTDDERPVHRVQFTQPFYLGVFEVTRGQFAQFVAATGHKTDAEKEKEGGQGWNGKNFVRKPEFTWRDWGAPQTDAHPVVNVSWNDAVAFCAWLSNEEGRTYRLPTEAEWEYACRAGTTVRNYNGNDPERLVEIGNLGDASAKSQFGNYFPHMATKSDGFAFTAPVGKFPANAFGLHDMIGNVWEWCADWYQPDYYASSPTSDPIGPSTGPGRAIRGGGWNTPPHRCRAANRDNLQPDRSLWVKGFRVACDK